MRWVIFQKIFELGAGGGYLLHDLQTLYPDVEVILVDSSAEMRTS